MLTFERLAAREVGSAGLDGSRDRRDCRAVRYGISDADWAAATEEIRTILIATAKRKTTIAYSALTSRMKTVQVEPDSLALRYLLRDVSADEDAAKRGMLTVLVVHKTGDLRPGPGFFILAQELGRDTGDHDICWVNELNAVYAAWK